MRRDERERAVGWAFVAIQAVLLVALVRLPGRDHWATPAPVEQVANVVGGIGIVVLVVAAVGLGRALTPTPVPKSDSALVVTGLYRFVRHPIYTGVLGIVVGIVVRSGNLVTLVLGVVTLVFFNAKAAWEERRLVRRYGDYEAYAARTPRFVPGLNLSRDGA